MALFLVFLLAVIVGGIPTGQYVGTEEVSVFQVLLSPFENFARVSGWTMAGIFPIPKVEFPWFSAMWTALVWDYSIFEGTYGTLIKYALWAFFSIPIVIGIGMWVAGLIRGSG